MRAGTFRVASHSPISSGFGAANRSVPCQVPVFDLSAQNRSSLQAQSLAESTGGFYRQCPSRARVTPRETFVFCSSGVPILPAELIPEISSGFRRSPDRRFHRIGDIRILQRDSATCDPEARRGTSNHCIVDNSWNPTHRLNLHCECQPTTSAQLDATPAVLPYRRALG
jgi:hypothetical protein